MTPIRNDGWLRHNIWEHSTTVKELYARRCRMEAEEMTCAAQAAELLAPMVAAGDTVLDAGCGSGYFYHSLRVRNLPVEYFGIDAAPSLIEIGRAHLPQYGLAAERLQVTRLEDLDGSADHVVCMNVLSNIDNYHRPLERLLQVARKSLILRESCRDTADYRYVEDRFLETDRPLKVHVNAYPIDDVKVFIELYGFSVRQVDDRRTNNQPELVIGYPHYWTFLVAARQSAAEAAR